MFKASAVRHRNVAAPVVDHVGALQLHGCLRHTLGAHAQGTRDRFVCHPGTALAIKRNIRRTAMLYYALVFFVIALVAALFGFGGIAAGAVGIAKILFYVFVVMAVATFIFGLIRRN